MNIDDPKMFKSKDSYICYCCSVWKEVEKMNAAELHGKTANDILCIADQMDSIPVDVKRILEVLNISAVPLDFTDMEKKLTGIYANKSILGAMVSNDKGTAIFYNNKDKTDSHRTRFTIAHEIAHCCLHGPTPHVEFRFDGATEKEDEIAANTFAGELLIPERALQTTISQLILPTVSALADIFDVSMNVMKQRLIHLNLNDKVMG